MLTTLLLLIVSLLTNISRATTVSAEEWYNPQISQTILLLGDCHLNLPNEDKKQLEAIINLSKSFKSHCIAEGMVEEGKVIPEIGSSLLLVNIIKECKENQLSFKDVECRYAFAALLASLVVAIDKLKTFNSIQEHCQSDESVDTINQMYIKCLEEASLFEKEIKNTTNAFKEQQFPNQRIIEVFEYATSMINELLNNISNELPNNAGLQKEDKASLVKFLIENTINDNLDEKTTLKDNSIFLKLFKLNKIYFEANIIKEIYQNRDKNLIIIITGCTHIPILQIMLKAFDYELNNFIKKNDHLEDEIQHLSEKKGVAEALFSSPELAKYAINLDEFVKNAKTLK